MKTICFENAKNCDFSNHSLSHDYVYGVISHRHKSHNDKKSCGVNVSISYRVAYDISLSKLFSKQLSKSDQGILGVLKLLSCQ